jgi:hypothetical protein
VRLPAPVEQVEPAVSHTHTHTHTQGEFSCMETPSHVSHSAKRTKNRLQLTFLKKLCDLSVCCIRLKSFSLIVYCFSGINRPIIVAHCCRAVSRLNIIVDSYPTESTEQSALLSIVSLCLRSSLGTPPCDPLSSWLSLGSHQEYTK